MKHLYCNRLRKNKDIDINNNSKSSFPLKQYINNGNRLNSFSGLNKIGVNRSENFNYLNRSNNLLKSYNQSGPYMQNYKSKNTSKCNNHSLYDSNKQQIINIENSHNYIRFESNNLEKIYKINKNDYLSTNNSIYNSIKNKNSKNSNNNNNIRNYTFQKNYFNNNITNINYNIKIQNFTNKKNNNNNSIATINYSNSNKNNKYINNINNKAIQNRNYLSSLKKNYNFTEINDTKKIKTPSEIKHQKKEPIQRNLTENNYTKEKENNKDKESRSTSLIKTQIFNNTKKDRINNTNKTNTHIYDFKEQKFKINLPIKLNIEDINKEKLSRLKRIIEQGSTNLNYYKMEISKNFFENNEKTQGKNTKVKKGKSQYIFKKKKINMIKKEECKEGDIKNKEQKQSNNFFNKSPIKKTNKNKNLILKTQFKNTNINNKFQSAMNSHNLFIQNGNNKNTENNKEKKHQRVKGDDINNNSINDDTISLSYSKEQNISFFAKKMNINEKNLFLPFSIEQFNIYYNNITKNLIINDKNNKKIANNESDDDDYQLTKEIILLKRGLAKKSELSAELRKKIRNMKTQRIYTLNLLGNKKVYRKKTSNYKITKL